MRVGSSNAIRSSRAADVTAGTPKMKPPSSRRSGKSPVAESTAAFVGESKNTNEVTSGEAAANVLTNRVTSAFGFPSEGIAEMPFRIEPGETFDTSESRWITPAELAHIEQDGVESDVGTKAWSWRQVLTFKPVWLLLFGRLLTDPIWYFFQFWFAKYLHSERGVSQEGLTMTWMIYAAAGAGSLAGPQGSVQARLHSPDGRTRDTQGRSGDASASSRAPRHNRRRGRSSRACRPATRHGRHRRPLPRSFAACAARQPPAAAGQVAEQEMKPATANDF